MKIAAEREKIIIESASGRVSELDSLPHPTEIDPSGLELQLRMLKDTMTHDIS